MHPNKDPSPPTPPGISPTVKKTEMDKSPFNSPSPQDTSPRLTSFTQHHRPVIAVHSGMFAFPRRAEDIEFARFRFDCCSRIKWEESGDLLRWRSRLNKRLLICCFPMQKQTNKQNPDSLRIEIKPFRDFQLQASPDEVRKSLSRTLENSCQSVKIILVSWTREGSSHLLFMC